MIYLKYFSEYLRHGDLKSLSASVRYVFTQKLPQDDFLVTSSMGKFYIRKNTNDFQFINYAYERSIKDYLVKNMNTFDVFIDVGACIGEYVIWLAGQGKKCIAIEPVNHTALRRNIALNGLEEKIQVYCCGLGNKKEKVYFNILEDVTSSSHVDRSLAGKEPNVYIEKLDDIGTRFNMSPSDRVIIKIDVEGMEKEVIEGANHFCNQFKDIRVIYEHFREEGDVVDKCLTAVCPFSFTDLDPVNRLAKRIG